MTILPANPLRLNLGLSSCSLIVPLAPPAMRSKHSNKKYRRTTYHHVQEQNINQASVQQTIQNFMPEAIYHAAGQINVRTAQNDPIFDAETNILGTLNVLEGARLAGTKNIIFSSTGGAIYGEQTCFPADETHPIAPETPYGISKRAAELYLQHYATAYSMHVVSLRYSNVYGPRQNTKGESGVVSMFTENLFSGVPLVIHGDGKQTRDFIYVGDVVAANLAASEANEPGKFAAYNIGHGIEHSIEQLVEAVKAAWPEDDIAVLQKPSVFGGQSRSSVDSTKFQALFDWAPKTDLKAGIAATIHSFRALKKLDFPVCPETDALEASA